MAWTADTGSFFFEASSSVKFSIARISSADNPKATALKKIKSVNDQI